MIALARKHSKSGFCIYTDTICQGRIPIQRDEKGYPVVYETEREAQKDIADDMILRLQHFLVDEREFNDAVSLDEYVVPVDVLPDGSVVDEWGQCFGKDVP